MDEAASLQNLPHGQKRRLLGRLSVACPVLVVRFGWRQPFMEIGNSPEAAENLPAAVLRSLSHPAVGGFPSHADPNQPGREAGMVGMEVYVCADRPGVLEWHAGCAAAESPEVGGGNGK